MMGTSWLEGLVRRSIASAPERLREQVEDWDPNKTKWKPELVLRASTFKYPPLFDTLWVPRAGAHSTVHSITRPNARYVNLMLPAWEPVNIYSGLRQGRVYFDGPVNVPALYLKTFGRWDDNPIMSMTPNEIMTLRPGTKLAKGHVVIAGLGLGHQLIEVSKRKTVTKITLIEKNPDVVDLLWEAIKRKLGPAPVELVVADARQVLKEIEADVALVDIFEGYGFNKLHFNTPRIGRVWCWGGAGASR